MLMEKREKNAELTFKKSLCYYNFKVTSLL